jgi:hypothetical protein
MDRLKSNSPLKTPAESGRQFAAKCTPKARPCLSKRVDPSGNAKVLLHEEAINTPFCPVHEKFHTFVLRGLKNISEAP